MTQNFNPDQIMKDLGGCLDRIAQMEAALEPIISRALPLVEIFAPFLPSGVVAAAEEIPQLQAEIAALKTFVTTELPLVKELIGAAGVGAAQTSGAVLADPNAPISAVELKPDEAGKFTGPANGQEGATSLASADPNAGKTEA
jgi:hypothetical protein